MSTIGFYLSDEDDNLEKEEKEEIKYIEGRANFYEIFTNKIFENSPLLNKYLYDLYLKSSSETLMEPQFNIIKNNTRFNIKNIYESFTIIFISQNFSLNFLHIDLSKKYFFKNSFDKNDIILKIDNLKNQIKKCEELCYNKEDKMIQIVVLFKGKRREYNIDDDILSSTDFELRNTIYELNIEQAKKMFNEIQT